METGLAGMGNGTAAQKEGPARDVAVYRTSSISCAPKGADNLHWVWHVNWLDEPERKWNPFEELFSGRELLRLGRASAPTDRQRRRLAMELKVFDSKCATHTHA